MFGPCMCGDTHCPSCGPAQGYDPRGETVSEWIAELLGKKISLMAGHNIIDVDGLADLVAETLGDDPEISDLFVAKAQAWLREYQRGHS